MNQIETIEVVYKRLLRKLNEEGFNLQRVQPINRGRYFIAFGEKEAVFVMYKRDFFNSFGKMFSHLGCKGVGESVNILDLQECLRYNVTNIYVVYSSGKAYKIGLIDFLTKGIAWKNDEGKEVKSVSIKEFEKGFEI